MEVSSKKASELVESLLGFEPEGCRPFGAGKFSQTFRAISDNKKEYILRIAPPDTVLQLFYEYRMMRQEPAIHKRLQEETSVPVPAILAYDFSRRLIDSDFLIMPRLKGQPLSSVSLNRTARARAFREWGRYVDEIHQIKDAEKRYGYLGEHHCMTPQRTWREAFRVMYEKELDDILGCGIYSKTQVRDGIKLLEDHLEVFNACETSRLCHGDLWVTNLLVKEDGEVTGVIDFDRACWGDIEWDLAIAEYCGVTRSAFWEGYGGMIDTHSGEAAIRRFFYLLYEHQKYIVISMSSRRNDRARARRYANECLAIMENFKRTGRPDF